MPKAKTKAATANIRAIVGSDEVRVKREAAELAKQLAPAEAGETTCCYARQDKFWVQGAPDGESWEIYTVLADSQTFYAEGHGPECCGGTGQPGDPAVSHGATCC